MEKNIRIGKISIHCKTALILAAILIPTLSILIMASLKKISLNGIVPFLSKPPCKNCNIILVSVDTLSADHLPCYGYHRNTAPNLCKFADNNILFTSSYSQSSYTLDSHMSIFTSLYPSSHNVLTPFKDSLHPDILTLPQALKGNGYETIFVGPIDDPALPLDKGFGRGFDEIITNHDVNFGGWNEGYQRFLENTKQNKKTFIFLHTYAVHEPYLVDSREEKRLFTNQNIPHIVTTDLEFKNFSSDFLEMVLDSLSKRIETSNTVESSKRNREIFNSLKEAKTIQEAEAIFNNLPAFEIWSFRSDRYDQKIDKNDAQQIEYIKALYDENIFLTDIELARLFGFLSQNNLTSNTIVVITSDHGEEFMEHGKIYHNNNLYNTSTHVPLIVSVPGIKKQRINSLVQGIDIYPTILGLIGIKTDVPLEGVNLSDLLLKRLWAKRNKYAVSEYSGGLFRSIQDERWKLYVFEQLPKETELYDILNDPQEQKNLIHERPGVAASLSQALEKIMLQKIQYPGLDTSFPDWIDTESREKLRKKGYF